MVPRPQKILDPRAHASLDAAGREARDVLASGLHIVFVAVVGIAIVSIVIATRLPAHDLETAQADAA